VSRLSPHLHWGEISPRQIWTALHHAVQREGARSSDCEIFLRELYWREFCHHLLYHYPELPERNWRPEFDAFPWRDDVHDLEAWRRGRTGYPFVDAGMRELWATGYMHNRVRMAAASFLVKHLRIHWREGERWFWDTLVDADLANNGANWQWVAGTGADAAPYFRIFNPAAQGRKFDPDGAYVRRWIPELRRLPNQYIHAPFAAPLETLRAAGVRLGETYPRPIVELDAGRASALAGYEAVRNRGRRREE
jgi:deoxyribodipyrimidine photo-lyase